MRTGLIQVYTGEGKGKTTAALGLALRAIGQGLKVCFIQFMKPTDFATGEMAAAKRVAPGLKMVQFGSSETWGKGQPKHDTTIEMQTESKNALDFAKKVTGEGHYDIIVLDEINLALDLRLLDMADVVELLKRRPSAVELILTGRGAPQEIIDMADLVTEMVEVKHPYQSGVMARRGIEY